MEGTRGRVKGTSSSVRERQTGEQMGPLEVWHESLERGVDVLSVVPEGGAEGWKLSWGWDISPRLGTC